MKFIRIDNKDVASQILQDYDALVNPAGEDAVDALMQADAALAKTFVAMASLAAKSAAVSLSQDTGNYARVCAILPLDSGKKRSLVADISLSFVEGFTEAGFPVQAANAGGTTEGQNGED